MLVVPGKDAVQAIQKVFFFVEAVGLARVHNEFRLDAITFEAAVEFLALARRIDWVSVALENERWRLHILEMNKGGAVQESRDPFWLVRQAIEPLVVGRTLLGAVFGDEIG